MPRKLKDRRPRMEIPSQYPGEMIYVLKRLYDGILKKATIVKQHSVGGIGGKVIIEYQPNRGKGYGVLVLNDIGPLPKADGG